MESLGILLFYFKMHINSLGGYHAEISNAIHH